MGIFDFILDLLPNTDYFFLFYLLGVFLVSILLIFFLSKKFKNNNPQNNITKEITIDDLLKIANNSKSTLKDLLFALTYFNEHLDFNKNINKSFELLKKILNHQNRNKALFDYFHGNILPNNLKYKNELNKLEQEALNKK